MTPKFCNDQFADRRVMRAAPGLQGTPMRRLSDLDEQAFARFVQQLLADAALQRAAVTVAVPEMA